MARFRKKPVEIKAAQITPEWFRKGFVIPLLSEKCPLYVVGRVLEIFTLEGVMVAQAGDWLIKDAARELYPCKDGIFRKTYEPVDEEAAKALNLEGQR